MTDRPPLPPLTSTTVFSPDAAQDGMSPAVAVPVSFDALMQAHLARVFNDRDGERRLNSLQELSVLACDRQNTRRIDPLSACEPIRPRERPAAADEC